MRHTLIHLALGLVLFSVMTLDPHSTAVQAAEVTGMNFQRAGNRLIQTFYVKVPASSIVSFAFCSGLTCGHADPECASDKWMPTIPDASPASLTFAPPPGTRLRTMYAKGGTQQDGLYYTGFYDKSHTGDWNKNLFGQAPTTAGDGSVTLSFPASEQIDRSPFLRTDATTGQQKICGLTETDKNAYVAKQGNGVTPAAPLKKITLVWEVANGGQLPLGFQQNFSIDGVDQPFIPYNGIDQPIQLTPDQTYLSNEANGNTTMTAALATILSALGTSVTPQDISALLSGNPNPTIADVNGALAALNSTTATYQLTPTNSLGAIQGLQNNQPTMMTYVDGHNQTQTVYITGYNPSSDQFTVFNPTIQNGTHQQSLSYNDVTNNGTTAGQVQYTLIQATK